MTTLTVSLILAALVLGTAREPGSDARTPAELAAAVRAAGWRAPLYALAGVLALWGLVVGCAGALTLSTTAKAAYGLALVLSALAWHLWVLVTGRPASIGGTA